MQQIVVEHRAMSRVLALLPAVVVAAAVRGLTLTTPPLPVRLLAAAAVGLACWVAYRLLTAHVVVGDTGVEVRGVLYDAVIPYAELQAVEVAPSGRPLRALVWGVMAPHSLVLHTSSQRLRPIAAISTPDDDDLARAVSAIRVRLAARGDVSFQRQPAERVSPG